MDTHTHTCKHTWTEVRASSEDKGNIWSLAETACCCLMSALHFFLNKRTSGLGLGS